MARRRTADCGSDGRALGPTMGFLLLLGWRLRLDWRLLLSWRRRLRRTRICRLRLR
jgi:hypothetical protein